ncbi:MAG TPA: hypothetical protein VHN73_00300 [Phenylobacterium sp.]|nr:hypothetical protein [Phenylobacterium sp.]
MSSSRPPRAGGVHARRAALNLALRAPTVRRVCRRVAAGETIQEICRDPLMPLAQDLHAWIAEEPEFAAMMRQARRTGPRPGLERPGRSRRWSEALAKEFLARIADGRGLVEICSEPDMPSSTTVYRWLRGKPEFALAYAQARQAQADFLFDLAWTIARRAGEEGDVGVARLQIQTIKWRCARLTPTVYGTAAAARMAQEKADEDSELWIEARQFALSPDDPNKVIEVFPENPESWKYERRNRGRGGG